MAIAFVSTANVVITIWGTSQIQPVSKILHHKCLQSTFSVVCRREGAINIVWMTGRSGASRLHGRMCEAMHMYHRQQLCSGLHDLFHEHRHHEVLLCAKWRHADFRLSAVQTHYSYLKSQNDSTPSFCSRISIQSISLQTITHFELGQSCCMPVALRCCCKASYTCTGNDNDLC